MTFTYNPGPSPDPITIMRMLIRDRNAAAPVFQDEELQAYLAVENNIIKLAAANAMDDIASDNALLGSYKTGDKSVNGPAVAVDLRDRAKELRRQVNEDFSTGSFDIVATDHETRI
jgi:hypothetical protein